MNKTDILNYFVKDVFEKSQLWDAEQPISWLTLSNNISFVNCFQKDRNHLCQLGLRPDAYDENTQKSWIFHKLERLGLLGLHINKQTYTDWTNVWK